MKNCIDKKIYKWTSDNLQKFRQPLIIEEPLSIRIHEQAYLVMRTPGDELAHVAGFCLGEGIVDSPDDIDGIHFSNDHNTNVITLKLNHKKTEQIYKYSDKTQYINNITEPICGSEFIKDLPLSLNPIGKNHVVEIEKSLKLLANLSQHQPLREKTRSAHAAAIYDEQYNLLSIAEDVGRHNAVDKAVGKLFLTKNLNQGVFLVLSSRISYELVQKAARAKIPIILAISKPTSLAVSLASELHMTLASQAKGGGLLIFCGKHRFCNNLQ